MKFVGKYLFYIAFAALIVSCQQSHNNYRNSQADRATTTLLIQPVAYENIVFEEEIVSTIQQFYGFRVAVAPNKIPPESFINYEKGFRYAAPALLKYLKKQKPDTVALVLGLTQKDIYTSKKDKNGQIKKPKSKYKVWGIMGLATRPGTSAIVSTKRLKTNDIVRYKDRLLKVILHEIGHNLGLKHCANKKCLMTDAVEKVSTIDNTSLSLCSVCTAQVGN